MINGFDAGEIPRFPVHEENTMIDEELTWKFYGYYSDELKQHSHKPIVVRCDECCKYRIVQNKLYRDLCMSCCKTGKRNGMFGKHFSDDAKHKSSFSHVGKWQGKEHVADRHHSDETRLKISISNINKHPMSEETRKRQSATKQGIPYEEWEGFSSNGEYCEKFDNACKERIREKYDRRCYICDNPECENAGKDGKTKKLYVHHVDRNKNQGCDGIKWNLIPVCMHCHPGTHSEPMKSRLEYLTKAG